MTGGETVEVRDWKYPGWEGRRGLVIRVTKTTIMVRFSDWSPCDCEFKEKDWNKLHIVQPR